MQRLKNCLHPFRETCVPEVLHDNMHFQIPLQEHTVLTVIIKSPDNNIGLFPREAYSGKSKVCMK